MPAKNPRVNVVLERPMYATLARLARRTESRERTFDRSPSLSHTGVWKAVDWSYESNKLGAEFLKGLPLSPSDRAKIAHGNAERVLRM